MRLSELKTGDKAMIRKVGGAGQFRKRILEMGFVQGKEIVVIKSAPMGDPIYYKILDYAVSLRRSEAELIEVELISLEQPSEELSPTSPLEEATAILPPYKGRTSAHATKKKKIKVALVGNPNCGKTSLFNWASGAHEHVGNYSGVTVESKTGRLYYGDYQIELVDLPGTYSLSPYSPEELYIRQALSGEQRPDVVINVVDTSNLERNLFLSIQVKEMGLPMVMALNMFDEFMLRKEYLNYPSLGKLIGIPMIPTVCRSGLGVESLLHTVVKVAEAVKEGDPSYLDEEEGLLRPIKVYYGPILEPELSNLTEKIIRHLHISEPALARYYAIKLIEGDPEIEQLLVKDYPKGGYIISHRNFLLKKIQTDLGDDNNIETIVADQRYGYIAGALRETYKPNRKGRTSLTDRIDRVLTSKIWGFPIFLLFMLLTFSATFLLGNYPMQGIEYLVDRLASWVGEHMAEGPLSALITDGIIGGVGGVIVFLPNILILYFFISLMEDTGYMARAAFIMDKIMHRMGLHGKSFISLIMGFGCNVPAIMSTRTIESRKSRLITMLVLPFMSCSARLPVYLLFAGALFPNHAVWVLFTLYLLGVAIAVVSARLLKSTFIRGEDVPFVMELPPYRLPTWRSVVNHMWTRSKQYLRKMGTVILVASIIVWFLGYFPVDRAREAELENQIAQVEADQSLSLQERQDEVSLLKRQAHLEHQEQSYIGRLGKWSEPLIRPLGFDWKMGVSLISGLAAKEVVVSTLGVIYTGDGEDEYLLTEKIRSEKRADGSPSFTPLVAFGFMIFVLVYFPCIATVVAIGKESGSWRWSIFSVVYSCLLAYLLSFLVYQIGSQLIS